MSIEQNIEMSRQLIEEIFNRGNIKKIDELMAPNFVEHEELPPGLPGGREGVKQLTGMLRAAFPDFRATINDIIADNDKVVIRQTWSGTQKGEFLGVPPTGKRVSWAVIDILLISGGKVTEHWGMMDNMGMMQQLGVIPAQRGA